MTTNRQHTVHLTKTNACYAALTCEIKLKRN